MKQSLVILFSVFLSLTITVKADEGMWLPMLLGEQVYADMLKKGLKLSKEQLYSINKACIKDAIIIFGGGCTGEIVSKEGLIFTNHHCGYDAIASASSVDHNYLKDGFWSKSKDEEIYAPGVFAQFLIKIEDVTEKVNAKLQGIADKEVLQKLPEILKEIAKKETEGTGYEGRVASMFKANQFLLFVYEKYKDVRLVGTPPESIGKFGGDTDNWEWPRHTGDFSIFRVYTGKNGKPAEYSKDNIPLKSKYSLPVSLKGVKDGDYTMIWGYPGGTNRYETSYGVKLKTDIENPTLVTLRDVKLKYMLAEMKKDPAIKIKLASSYAGIANYWKFFDGETKQLLKFKTFETKQEEEKTFQKWATGKSTYDSLFQKYQSNYAVWEPYAAQRVYLNEGILGSPLLKYASSLSKLESVLKSATVTEAEKKKTVQDAIHQNAEFNLDENISSDKNILAFALQSFYKNVLNSQHPKDLFENIQNKYGKLTNETTFEMVANNVFNNTILTDSVKFQKTLSTQDTSLFETDPAIVLVNEFIKNYNIHYLPLYNQFMTNNFILGKLYLKGVLEQNKGKAMYPDANFTMRVSYGQVKSYTPKDGVKFSYICTLNGILEKYKPGDYEFDVPEKLIQLAQAKDFGRYADKSINDIVVSFISSNDITGGNSGSPVLNGNGELIGLAFDGNYEALSHKIHFDTNLNRTINLDVRYLLWVVEKIGGAKNIINELNLVP